MRARSHKVFAFTAVVVLVGFQAVPVLAADIQSSWSSELIWAGRIFNVVLLLGGLGYVLRKPLKNFLQNRTDEIRKKLDEAEEARLEAVRKLSLMEERLQRLDEEVAAIRLRAEADAEAEQRRILQQAEVDAERIRARARLEIDARKAEALAELKQFVAEKAVTVAEEMIRREITPADRERLFDKFLAGIGDKR